MYRNILFVLFTIFALQGTDQAQTMNLKRMAESDALAISCEAPLANQTTDKDTPAVGYYGDLVVIDNDVAYVLFYVSKDKGQFWLQGVVTNEVTGQHFGVQGRYSPAQGKVTLTRDKTYSDGKTIRYSIDVGTRLSGYFDDGKFTITYDDEGQTDFSQPKLIKGDRDHVKKLLENSDLVFKHPISFPDERSEKGNKPTPNEAGASPPPSSKGSQTKTSQPGGTKVPGPTQNKTSSSAPMKALGQSGVSSSKLSGTDAWALVREELISMSIDRRSMHPQAHELSGSAGYFSPHHYKEISRGYDEHNDGTWYRSTDMTFVVNFSPAPAILRKGEIYAFTVQATADMPVVTNQWTVHGGWNWGPLKVVSDNSSNADPKHPYLWLGRDAAGFIPFSRYTANVRLISAPDEFQVEETCLSLVLGGKATITRYTYRKNAVPVRANETWGGATIVGRQGVTSYRLKGGTYLNLPNLDTVNGHDNSALGIGDRVKTGSDGQIVIRTTSGALVAIEPNSEIEIGDGGKVNVLSGKRRVISGEGP